MTMRVNMRRRLGALIALAGLGLLPGVASATIIGWVQTGPSATFDVMAKADTISTGDGDSVWMWGYAQCASASSCNRMQYPGPTLIVDQGAVVTINLRNQLPLPVSMVFPGQSVTVSGGTPGLLTSEITAASPGTTVTTPVVYSFTASKPGTYMYYSGTHSDLEIEMGLFGAIIVRPAGFSATAPQAYGDPSTTAYEREYLFVVSELDPLIHQQVAFATFGGGTNLVSIQNGLAAVDMSQRHAVDWFVNGRNFPDTVAPPNPPLGQTGYPGGLAVAAWLPTQPYNIFPQMYPGERVLIRWVSGGLDMHPYHTHGQNHLVIARDGRVLSTTPGAAAPVADLAPSDYTTTTVPGETVDAIWGPWTGEKLGWDVYGHTGPGCGPGTLVTDPPEYAPDHCKAIPVVLPFESNTFFGPFYSGSPYLGDPEVLPPLNPDGTVHVDQNPLGGLAFMWHSHSERELTTNDVFIGGMATMGLVVPRPAICPTGLNCTIW